MNGSAGTLVATYPFPDQMQLRLVTGPAYAEGTVQIIPRLDPKVSETLSRQMMNDFT